METLTARTAFEEAQARVLARYGVEARPRFVDVTAIGGRAQVLVAGEGPPLVLVIGGTTPAALWGPLMARLPGRTLYAMDLPGFGLTTSADFRPETYRETAVGFLGDLLDALGLASCAFVTHSMGSLWTLWLAHERPGAVQRQTMVGCPALVLGSAAPWPMRLASVPRLGPRLVAARPPSAAQVEQVIRMVGEDPAGLAEIRDVLLACERLPGYAGQVAGMMRSVMSWTRVRPEMVTGPAELRDVAHPVQLVWGRQDPFGPPGIGRRCAELLPDAHLAVVPGGHAPWLHGADAVGAALSGFLGLEPA